MNEVCIEQCAPKRDMSHFKPDKELELEAMPRFPMRAWQEEMTSKERQACAAIYLAKAIDHLQGVRIVPKVR
ncbi:MAG: hypothetical protein MN733_35395 [Nitrososphaera sp.]|nr:hypothetical protein [Nitrososphaera sp.]